MITNADFRVGSISAIIHKTEPNTFFYECKSRGKAGFVFVTDGTGTFQDQTGSYPLKKHSIMVVPKDYKYSVRAGGQGIAYVTTGFDLTPQTLFADLQIPTCIQLEKHPYFMRQLMEMLEIWEKRGFWYLTETRMLMDRFLLELIKCSADEEIAYWPDSKLTPAIRYINQNYDKPIQNETLAQLCNLSQTHFRRLFTQQVGLSPLQYRESIRVHWATKFLKTQMFSISEIAEMLGYTDVYHFSKVYKKSTGHSPSYYKYRKEKDRQK